jgi:hypothetical protein
LRSVVARLRWLNWLKQGIGSQLPKTHPSATYPSLRAEVVRTGQQKAILLEHLADGIGTKVEWLDVVHRLECDFRQQVDEVVIAVADHGHTGRVLTRTAHIVVDDCLSTGKVLQSETILLANSSRLT